MRKNVETRWVKNPKTETIAKVKTVKKVIGTMMIVSTKSLVM